MAQIHYASPGVFYKMLWDYKVWHVENVSIPWSWWYNMQWAFFTLQCLLVLYRRYFHVYKHLLTWEKKSKVKYILNTNERVLITVYESLLSSTTLWYEGIDTLIMVFKTKTNKQHTDPAYLPVRSRSIYILVNSQKTLKKILFTIIMIIIIVQRFFFIKR